MLAKTSDEDHRQGKKVGDGLEPGGTRHDPVEPRSAAPAEEDADRGPEEEADHRGPPRGPDGPGEVGGDQGAHRLAALEVRDPQVAVERGPPVLQVLGRRGLAWLKTPNSNSSALTPVRVAPVNGGVGDDAGHGITRDHAGQEKLTVIATQAAIAVETYPAAMKRTVRQLPVGFRSGRGPEESGPRSRVGPGALCGAAGPVKWTASRSSPAPSRAHLPRWADGRLLKRRLEPGGHGVVVVADDGDVLGNPATGPGGSASRTPTAISRRRRTTASS